MTDTDVSDALRSSAALVVIEAAAGCGKTFQAGAYAAECSGALRPGRMLILTHTHAACSVIAKRAANANAEIRTLDSLIIEIAAAYHKALGLPADVSTWARERKNGYDEVTGKVHQLLNANPPIASALADRYPVVVCDEHQDSSENQHSVVMRLRAEGARLRIFGDPMQIIYASKGGHSASVLQWESVWKKADVRGHLEHPHRWAETSPELGVWIQEARVQLRDGKAVDLRKKLPKGVSVIRVDNQARGYGQYRMDKIEREEVDQFVDATEPLLVLSSRNGTVRALRSAFFRRLPIWEGHTRDALDKLVRRLAADEGDPAKIARHATQFLGEIAVGFSATAFATRFAAEVSSGCKKKTVGKPALIQELARCILAEPNHKGLGTMLRRINQMILTEKAFETMKVDHTREWNEAVQLAYYDDPRKGHSEITRRRTYLHPQPAKKALSTIHKAKGLECTRVMVMPCDAQHLSDTPDDRCLLYVALSRPVSQLALVVPRENPSPLLQV
jgi:hypothetical protein